MTVAELAAVGAIAGVISTLLGGLVAIGVAWGRTAAKVERHERQLDRHDSYIVELKGETGEHRGKMHSIHEEGE